MSIELIVTLTAVFVSVGLAASAIAAAALSRTAPEVQRLRQSLVPGAAFAAGGALSDRASRPGRGLKPLRKQTFGGLQKRLAAAGWDHPQARSIYMMTQAALLVSLASIPLLAFGVQTAWPVALIAAALGYMAPDFFVSHRIAERKLATQNGLPDALDLLVVCMEAGSSLDQAILRTSEELKIALPSMALELGTISSEIRAGKPRLEAFQGFAKRTNLDEVRALVSMLIQADRFGTSIAQTLRTHAQTLRTKRRQRAEERAGKVGVKLVFPLVLCLLPALYVVCLGPIGVRLYYALF
ncbi:MAG TPA: type II secretion system F family protein [Vicinamibacterales bacterium]|nr:type II secretion system F family protein [Vicinamibacterales bacterium]